jgi:hypothetical protein
MDETAVGGHHATAGRIIRLIGLIRLIRACQASYGQKEDLLPWSQPVLEGICLLRSKQTCLLTVLAPYTGLLMHTHPVHAFAGFGHGDGRYGRSYMRRPMLPSWLIAVLLVLHTCSCARLDDAGVVATQSSRVTHRRPRVLQHLPPHFAAGQLWYFPRSAKLNGLEYVVVLVYGELDVNHCRPCSESQCDLVWIRNWILHMRAAVDPCSSSERQDMPQVDAN